MSYCHTLGYLGEFRIPAKRFGQVLTNWVPGIEYIPRPPLAIRGAMNPWQAERQRELWQAEEAAWVKIKKLKWHHGQALIVREGIVAEMMAAIKRIEDETGQKMPGADIMNYAAMLYSFAGGPYAWAVTMAKFGFDYLMSSQKKKKIQGMVEEVERIQVRLQQQQSIIEGIEHQIQKVLRVTEAIKSAQTVSEAAARSVNAERITKRGEQETYYGALRLQQARQVQPKMLVSPYHTEDL